MFLNLVIFVFFAAVTCDEVANKSKIDQVKVDLYYESLCPDSKYFIEKQLKPVLQSDLSKYIRLNVYPYGKSTTKKTGDKYEFTCHHGEFECVGNKYHGCALKLIENAENSKNFNKNAMEYVFCMMENIYRDDDKKPRAPIDKCKDILGERSGDVEKCAQNQQGDQFLAEFGKITDEFQKPLKSVPTIVFNGIYDADESKKAYGDFLSALCEKFGETKPEGCSK